MLQCSSFQIPIQNVYKGGDRTTVTVELRNPENQPANANGLKAT